MEKLFTILEIIVPIFVVILLGNFAKRKNMISEEQNQGLQQFVMKFGLPCVLFNSCLTAQLGAEAVTTMAMLLPLILISTICSFYMRRKFFPYHNLPMMFSAQESGMLGIPLFMTLFGAGQAYRMGVMDMTQSFVAIPVIAILASNTGENPKVSSIIKEVFKSPLLLMSLLGLFLNLTGVMDTLNQIGIGTILTETTGFLAGPVSAVILFSVGYNFSLGEGNRKQIFKLCGIHFGMFFLFGLIMQAILFFLPAVEPETRWAVFLFTTLPPSYLSAGLGRNKDESRMASGVCSILTAVSLVIFCVITAMIA
jgi:predicted permease